MSRRGLTLIELLVVVAIVAVLLALLFPAFNSVTDRAATSKCAGNLKRIGQAHGTYIADNDGMLIPAATGGAGDRAWYHWLEPYLGGPKDGSESVYSVERPDWQECPAKHFPADKRTHLSVGYGWNQCYFGSAGWGEPSYYNPSYRRLLEVTHPSQTIIVADNMDHTAKDDWQWQYTCLYGPYDSEGMLARRHHGGGNYLFMDGHVEWMTPEDATREINNIDWYLFRRDKSISFP